MGDSIDLQINHALLQKSFDEVKRNGQAFRESLVRESERGLVLVAASYSEALLRNILRVFLDDHKSSANLFQSPAPLLTFSAMIDLCRALRLIRDDEWSVLHKIRKIRNDFAHRAVTNMNDGSIRDRIMDLPVKPEHIEDVMDDPDVDANHPRIRFTVCSVYFVNRLSARAFYAAYAAQRIGPFHDGEFQQTFDGFSLSYKRL